MKTCSSESRILGISIFRRSTPLLAMKETYIISAMEHRDEFAELGVKCLSHEQVTAIVKAFPEVKRTIDGFTTGHLAAENHVIPRIIDALLDFGFDLRQGQSSAASGVKLCRIRNYSGEDLLNYDYSGLSNHKMLGSADSSRVHDSNGLPLLESPISPIKAEYGMMSGGVGARFLLVRGSLKEKIEKASFIGLTLIEAKTSGKKPLPAEERAWFVSSSHVLPLMNNLCYSSTEQYFKYDPNVNYSKCYPYAGCLDCVEYYYNQNELGETGFDVAITKEGFGSRNTLQRNTIFSRRFISFMLEMGCELAGFPVHLVMDSSPPWVGPYPAPLDHLNIRPAWLDQYA